MVYVSNIMINVHFKLISFHYMHSSNRWCSFEVAGIHLTGEQTKYLFHLVWKGKMVKWSNDTQIQWVCFMSLHHFNQKLGTMSANLPTNWPFFSILQCLYHQSHVLLIESEEQKDRKIDRMYFMTGSLPNYDDLSPNFRYLITIQHNFDFVLAFLDCLQPPTS